MSPSPTKTKPAAMSKLEPNCSSPITPFEKPVRLNGAEQFAQSMAAALTLLDDSGVARHGSYWQRKHNAGVFSVLGYYSKKPGGKGRPSFITPDLLIVTHRQQLVLLIVKPATAKMRIEVYRSGAWEFEFCELTPTVEELIDELRALEHPAINKFIASVTPGPGKTEGN